MSPLSDPSLNKLREVVERRGLAVIARELGVCRTSLASVLVGRGRPSTRTAIAAAYLQNASKLGLS